MSILEYRHFHLVGIKGVAMTALAQCLIDAGKTVTGSDVDEKFVTQDILDRLPIEVQVGFDQSLPAGTDCVVFTSAHNAHANPQAQAALHQKLPTFSHAEALAELFNAKQGIAVSGVGGKSTTSAMIAWILEKVGVETSFAIGVGNIPGLEKTGQWSEASRYFVAEADEYVTDPVGARSGENFVARFSFLKPFLTVCTNLKFDHPDVYRDFAHTQAVYRQFFTQLKDGGSLFMNVNDQLVLEEMFEFKEPPFKVVYYGAGPTAEFKLTHFLAQNGISRGRFTYQQREYEIELSLPGEFNVVNALGAVAACHQLGVNLDKSLEALKSFHSTKRRSEFIGDKKGIKYYDDYAHHPSEVKSIIRAFQEWFPQQRLVLGFQSHTFSRTRELFNEFVDALGQAQEVVMIDIFASAREAFDDSVSSDRLCDAVSQKYPATRCQNLQTIERLADWCQNNLKAGDVFLTVGAGDIYKVHDLL